MNNGISYKIKATKNKNMIEFYSFDTKKKASFNLNTMELFNNNDRKVKSLNNFFKKVAYSEIEFIDMKIHKQMFDDIYQDSNLDLVYNFGTLLSRYEYFSHLEGYYTLGLKFSKKYLINYEKWIINKRFNKNVIKIIKKRDIDVGNIINNTFSVKMMNDLIEFMDKENYYTETIILIFNTGYEFKNFIEQKLNIKRIIKYIVNISISEGLNIFFALNLYSDYRKMNEKMGINYKKYPKYLRTMHDIANMHYKSFKKYQNKVAFKEKVNEKLIFKNKNYCTITPGEPKDLYNEGNILHHCVASYVDDIVKGRTQIIFLRDKKEIDKPLITLEIRDNKVVQARGKFNRNPNYKELNFIKYINKSLKKLEE